VCRAINLKIMVCVPMLFTLIHFLSDRSALKIIKSIDLKVKYMSECEPRKLVLCVGIIIMSNLYYPLSTL
jgi:hypothetical protein